MFFELTCIVSKGINDPSREVDEPGTRGSPGAGEAAGRQEEEELGVVLQGVLVGTLKRKTFRDVFNLCNTFKHVFKPTWMQLNTLSPPFSSLYMMGYLTLYFFLAWPTLMPFHIRTKTANDWKFVKN